jgi:hypothetical protein
MPPSVELVPDHPPDPLGHAFPPAAAAAAAGGHGGGISSAGWGLSNAGSEGAGRGPEGLGLGPAASLDDLDFYYDGGGRTEEQIGLDDWPGHSPAMTQQWWSGAAGAGWDGGKAAGGEAAVWGVLQQVVDQLGQLRQQVGLGPEVGAVSPSQSPVHPHTPLPQAVRCSTPRKRATVPFRVFHALPFPLCSPAPIHPPAPVRLTVRAY